MFWVSFFIFLPGIILFGQDSGDIDILYVNNILSIQNNLFERQFRVESTSNIHSFYPISWRDKKTGSELLSGENKDWFNFCLEDVLIQSKNGGWDYVGYKKRDLENGGVEVIINLSCQKEQIPELEGVSLNYYFQIFPNSTVMREKLEILPQINTTAHMTKFEDAIYLSFPQYSFKKSVDTDLNMREIKLSQWLGEILPDVDWHLRPNDRLQLEGGKAGRNLSQNHMYHPKRLDMVLSEANSKTGAKGPIGLFLDEKAGYGYIVAYEHGSPDDDSTQNYLEISAELKDNDRFQYQVKALKGAYFNQEPVTKDRPYSTVWVDVGYFNGHDFNMAESTFWDFIYRNQSEHLAPRKPTIYYNTWGMQRDEQKEKKVRPQEVITEDRILEEIEYAHQLGVDVFVIDDGWQNYFGDWQPVTDRFPNRFNGIKSRLDSLGMRMGLWMAAEGIDPESDLFKSHPEWLVRNADGSETIGRWKKPIGCFSSGYKEYFAELCKYWIDQGFAYFKWDGLDKHLCYSPDHAHGNSSVDPEERAYRSGYDFILAVTDVAREITEYNPNVVIVYDMTEELRNVGLAFLSESRFFWINNGATWYDDLSYYRTKSIRTVANEYNQIIPTILQTSANYPHQSEMYGAQRFNLNTTLLGGGGFWGDLSEMTSEERERIGEVINIYKNVSNTVVSTRPIVSGKVGASPEIYEFIDPQKSEGQVVAFSGSALNTTYTTQPIDSANFFCVLRNAFILEKDGSINLRLLFPQPDATCEAFVISAQIPARIKSSTCWLKSAEVTGDKSFTFVNGAPGQQYIIWPEILGEPKIITSDEKNTKTQIQHIGNEYQILIEESIPEVQVIVSSKIK
jgi:alpha-galactosidase